MTPVADMSLDPNWQPLVSCYLLVMPLQILQQICQHLGEDTNSLVSMARICRTINSVVVPIFYRGIKDPVSYRRDVLALAASFMADPAHRQHIRSLTMARPHTWQRNVEEAFQLVQVNTTVGAQSHAAASEQSRHP
jgi:hypothetical protein